MENRSPGGTLGGGPISGFSLAVLAVAALATSPAQEAPPATLSKPLAQYTVGDLLPRATDDTTRETGKAWRRAAGVLEEHCRSRLELVRSALQLKRSEVRALEQRLRAARKAKEFVEAGTLQGTLESERSVVEILDRVDTLSREQAEVARAWSDAGTAMVGLVEADDRMDPLRLKRIKRPDTPEEPDERLDATELGTFRSHAAALRQLGERFSALGDELEEVAGIRLRLFDDLERGGRVKPPDISSRRR